MSYTAGEAAKRLGVSRDSIKRYARDGKLRGTRTPGGHHRFELQDLDRFQAGLAPDQVETAPHRRLVMFLLVAFDGDLAKTEAHLSELRLPLPDLMTLQMGLRKHLSDDARTRADSGGHWVSSLEADGDWLEQAEIAFLVRAFIGHAQAPGRIRELKCRNHSDHPKWLNLLLPDAIETRFAVETLLLAKRLRKSDVRYELNNRWRLLLSEQDLDCFIQAAFDMNNVDLDSYLFPLPPREQEIKQQALEASRETVLALLDKAPLAFMSEEYNKLLILARDRLEREIRNGDAKNIAHLLKAVRDMEVYAEHPVCGFPRFGSMAPPGK